MSETIRTLRLDELDAFQRLLERCYGHRRGFNDRASPDLFRADEEATDCWLVVESDGRIVSHVGTYPLEVVLGPARVMTGGIGDVATLPGERGKGYMARLLEAIIARMRERGIPLSALWGDRQRYGSFGWETCGLGYILSLNRRSLERSGVQPAEIEEVDPRDPEVVARVRELHATLPFRVERPRLGLTLLRGSTRVFLGADGYLLASNDYAGNPDVIELASPTGREAELVFGAMQWMSGGSAEVRLGFDEGERLERLARAMNHWRLNTQGMLRIIDWPRLLTDLRPVLEQRAAGVAPFEACLGCRWRGEVQWATIEWDGAALAVSTERRGDGIEVELPLLTALLLGGPHAPPARLGPFGHLLPVPLHIPPLDHV
jgi:predicted N-acetyltransferase YhbS